MNPLVAGILVILTTSLMGSSFAVGKIGLAYMSPLLLIGLRFTLAGVLMALVVIKKPFPKQPLDWGKIFLIGLFQTAGVMGCIFLSLRTIPAGESSILTFSNPLLVVILSSLFLGSRYQFSHWLGVLIGFMGVFITLGLHLQLRIGTLLGLGAAISWSIATILIKKWGMRFNIWVLTAYQMFFGGILLLLFSAAMETPKLIINPTSVFIVLWLAIMASIVQFAIWFYLLNQGDPGKTSAFLFLAPFFGVLSGWLLLDEVVEWYVYVGGLLIFIGIFLVNWTFSKKEQANRITAKSI
ncbi:DMT family transporter [Aneurinibacillus sp. Ricciae_BoGa-3]|uniref:DMT family transporter n=1 Tax=Aneurinibacillus sp. Ricciae_BoGa-3 TaxID=3022697 RepID=UPI0023409250|nr:DMT family transporter [Aneurinibacillus sp. Ricciae_BoGa-3]WCK55674.1 DMT family transporter [Aneurinibacillus sp. Ricciae_BoGa-3]